MLESDAVDGNQWYNSNGPIAGATGQTYEPESTDDYYSIVSNEFGCESGESNTIYFVYTGVSEKYFNSFSLYPNPNNGIFAVELNSEVSDNVNIKILNTLGSVIYVNENIEVSGYYKTIIDLSEFNKGMYFLVLENYRGSTVNRIIIR